MSTHNICFHGGKRKISKLKLKKKKELSGAILIPGFILVFLVKFHFIPTNLK